MKFKSTLEDFTCGSPGISGNCFLARGIIREKLVKTSKFLNVAPKVGVLNGIDVVLVRQPGRSIKKIEPNELALQAALEFDCLDATIRDRYAAQFGFVTTVSSVEELHEKYKDVEWDLLEASQVETVERSVLMPFTFDNRPAKFTAGVFSAPEEAAPPVEAEVKELVLCGC